jgi:lysozyme
MSDAQGLDVSRYQGDFDWRGHPDISFAAAKCYEAGAGEDKQFADNWADMWTTFGGKLVRFAYVYAHPDYSPVIQAETFVQLTRDHGLQLGDHFIMDLETAEGCRPEQVNKWARVFSRRVNDLAPDHRCLSYTNPGFCVNGIGWGDWPLFIADYGVAEPAVPAPWKAWRFWQKSASGLDLDVFAGDREALLTFARMPADRR